MANPEHVARIKKGVREWNRWRVSDPTWPDLSGADLRDADLIGADLSRADLSRADLRGANLRGANLSGAYLRGANLSGAYLSGAVLTEAHIVGVNLHAANLTGADFSEATLGYTIFADTDLSETEGLESCNHIGPSSIGIDTFFRSKGEIPERFLRGCGVPEQFITYARSLVGQPIQFYSCFISYSTKDQDFADRLYADLQSKGVRCWLASEDLKIGDKFRSRIDESIRVFDKLLLVLSQHSIASAWVEDEVEAALARESREKRLVVFPIRLDDAIMQTGVAWADHLRHKRHIGDFRGWKDHDGYQKAFERLLRDLKAESEAEARKTKPATP